MLATATTPCSLDKQNPCSIFEQVRSYIESTAIYRKKSLHLRELAKDLRLPEKAISHAINECTGDNVNAFINSYRIRLVEQMLRDPQFDYLTIDAIAEESGFSNKVTFYKAFRRIHPFSPREFKVGKSI